MSNLKSIYSGRKCRFSFLLLPHTTQAQQKMFWENYFNIAILLVIEALLARQGSEQGGTFLGLGAEGRLMFNFAECFVNWERGNGNQNKERTLLVTGKSAGCDGSRQEQGMLQELGNPGPGWGKMRHRTPWAAVGRGERRLWGSTARPAGFGRVREGGQERSQGFVQLGEE